MHFALALGIILIFMEEKKCTMCWHDFDKYIFFLICIRIFAPTAYIFFASALPVIAFGAQLSRDTGTCSRSLKEQN